MNIAIVDFAHIAPDALIEGTLPNWVEQVRLAGSAVPLNATKPAVNKKGREVRPLELKRSN